MAMEATVSSFLNPLEGHVLDTLVASLTPQQLARELDRVSEQIRSDMENLSDVARRSKFRVDLTKFEDLSYLISKTLPPGIPNGSDEHELLRFCIGRFFLCRLAVERVMKYLKGDFNELLSHKADVEAPKEGPGWTRIGRYLDMLRYFVRFHQERAILRDLAHDYAVWLDISTSLLAKKAPDYSKVPRDQEMPSWTLSAAPRDLLLEGTSGRFSSPLLVRAVIELALTRSLIQFPKYGSIHRGKTIQLTPRFRISALLDTARSSTVCIPMNPSNEAVETLYKWGNRAVHEGITYPMEELVFAQAFVDDLDYSSELGPMFSNTDTSKIDALLQKLLDEGRILLQ
jgi:hypothetical protein